MPFPDPMFRKTARRLVSVVCWAIALPYVPAFAQSTAKCDQVPRAVEQAITRILKVPKARLQPGQRLVEDLGASDQGLPSLTMHLEDTLLVILPDELADGSGTTMQSYVDAIDKELGCPVRR